MAHNNTDKDIAILQLETKQLPANSNIVDLSQAVTEDNQICVGSHIYTIGFPFGLSLQDLKSPKGIQLLGHGEALRKNVRSIPLGLMHLHTEGQAVRRYSMIKGSL